MQDILDILFCHTWWDYERDARLPYSAPYHWFNIFEGSAWLVFIFEGSAWLVFSLLVLRRYLKHRRSQLEIWYALLFVTFALSDFREAWAQQSWLIWFKLANLIGLFVLRRIVMQRFYPAARIF